MQNCMACGKGFSVTVRKVRSALMTTPNESSPVINTFPPPLWLFSTTADTVGTFSALNVRQRTPSHHPPKSRSGCVRPASRSSKADSPPLSFTSSTTRFSPPFPTPAGRRQRVFVRFYCALSRTGAMQSPARGSWLMVAVSPRTGVM